MDKHALPQNWKEARRIKRTSAQLGLLPEVLSHGAEADGVRGNVWTCARVAGVIWAEFGVAYHKAHVSRLLELYPKFKTTNWRV